MSVKSFITLTTGPHNLCGSLCGLTGLWGAILGNWKDCFGR